MEEKATKSVRFNSDTDLKFSKLSEKLGRSKQELFGQMVDYFYKSKKDPADLNDELLKKELGQGLNRIISFIKTQEKEALTPMLADLTQLQRSLNQLSDQYASFFQVGEERKVEGFFLKAVQRQLQEQQTLQQQQRDLAQTLQNLLSETRTYQNEVKTHRDEKNALKAKFRTILDSYIQQREALNNLTQGRTVKDLQEQTRTQVNNL